MVKKVKRDKDVINSHGTLNAQTALLSINVLSMLSM